MGMKIGSSTRSQKPGESSLTIEGLSPAELDLIRSMLLGLNWITTNDFGNLIGIPAKFPLPFPTEDEMLPFWRPLVLSSRDLKVQEELFDPERSKQSSQPSICIQSLCGYNYTKDKYVAEATKLTRWGFQCLRSRRGADGHYWEIWYLPGAWAAKEELKEASESNHPDWKTRQQEEHGKLLEFLRRNVQFGTLDASVQRLCMTVDD